ncbi:MAG: DUF4037 domain-containing protein [Candidatus Heimdallarchaeota archaeon]
MKDFITGLKLTKHFYHEVVKPLLDKHFPKLNYSAARIGSGSDVLGFDTIRSTDHDWGEDYDSLKDKISEMLSEKLPKEFMGYATNYRIADDGVKIMDPIQKGNAKHNIVFYTIKSFFKKFLGIDPYKEILEIKWLSFPEQQLLAVTSGVVYHDGLKELITIQEKFKYYPRNVWLFLMKMQWFILAEESSYLGRANEVKDEIGSYILSVNQLSKLMKLCFLMERKYAPYSKWFTLAFSKLKSGSKLVPLIKKIISTNNWTQQEKYLIEAYIYVANFHNDLKITEQINVDVKTFHNRPYLIINFDDYIDKIDEIIPTDSPLKHLKIGSILYR